MRIPLLKITIYSVAGIYMDPVNPRTYTKNLLTYELDCIEGRGNGLHDYFLDDYFDFDAFKSLFRRILRNIALFRHPILFKLMQLSSKNPNWDDWDDQMASETIYMDYMRVKSQYMEGSEGVYEHLKEAVHEIVITNAHFIQTTEIYSNRYGNMRHPVVDKHMSHNDTKDLTTSPNEDEPDECNTLGGSNTSTNE